MNGSGRIGEGVGESLKVELERHAMFVKEPFDVARQFQEEFGERSVYLLESLGGPDRDRERAVIGIGPLASVEVLDGEIRITGDRALRAALRNVVQRSGQVIGSTLIGSGDIWDVLREIMDFFDVPQASDARPDFGFLTVFSYDAVQYIENIPRFIPRPRERVSDITLTLYGTILDVDLRTGSGTLTTSRSALWGAIDPARVITAAGRAATAPHTSPDSSAFPVDVAPSTDITREDYLEWVDVALEHIRDGDVYQVQLGYEVGLDGGLQTWEIYARMRHTNPSPFMGMVPLRGVTLLSASPELHVLLQGGGATMRPIAGTSRRDGDPRTDADSVRYLQTAEKEHAEHIMLVDLCRNDLGKVAIPGSVRTPLIMAVEAYSHVYHLVSTVTATVEQGVDIFDVIRATFPAGTMTGAPKVRAMEVIESLELSPRGLYAGIFGVIGIGGYANLALTIRSVFCTETTTTSRASAGIVAESMPQSEWDETRAKMSAAVEATTGRIFS